MATLNKKVAILNTKAPFAHATAKEALDVALIYGSYEQETSLFYQGDGVYQLVNEQQPELINAKNFLKTFLFNLVDIKINTVSKFKTLTNTINTNRTIFSS